MTWHKGEGTNNADKHPDVQPGRRVEHRHYGLGYVTSRSRSGDRESVSVSFPEPFGTKVLNLAYAELTVLPDDDGASDAPTTS